MKKLNNARQLKGIAIGICGLLWVTFGTVHAEITHAAGVVQFWQVIPEGQAKPKGMSEETLRAALYCKTNHSLSQPSSQQYDTYINSCYVDEGWFLGESDDAYEVYVSGYQGWVPKSQTHTIEQSFYVNEKGEEISSSRTDGTWKTYTYTVYTTAEWIPLSVESDQLIPSETGEWLSDWVLKHPDDLEQGATSWTDKVKQWLGLNTKNETLKSPSFYANQDGALIHYISKNVTEAGAYGKVVVGVAPDWMAKNVSYFSYDGHYFFDDLANVTPDGIGAVNEQNPYYNYYQYLPIRSQTTLDGQIIEQFLTSLGYNQAPMGSTASEMESLLVGEGNTFVEAQTTYGINGALQFSMAVHESNIGRSQIGLQKRNLFGMNAVDASPSQSATAFQTVRAGILTHAKQYLSEGYSDALTDRRFYGFFLGNKGGGMNVAYASDPFWGEKIAGWYYRLDLSADLQDFETYTIGIANQEEPITLYSSPDMSSPVLYQNWNATREYILPLQVFLILGEEGEFYRIQTDMPINENGVPEMDADYTRETAQGYLLKSEIDTLYIGKTDVLLGEQDVVDETPVQAETQGQAEVLMTALNVRSEPSLESEILGQLNEGDIVEVFGLVEDWVEIANETLSGYVPSTYLRVEAAVQTRLKTTAVEMNVSTPLLMEAGTEPDFLDGVELQGLIEGTYTLKVDTSTFNPRKVGTQIVTYVLTYPDETLSQSRQLVQERSVRVVDTTPPQLTLKGATVISIDPLHEYVDTGVEVKDNAEGVIKLEIIGVETITATPGDYTIQYRATDEAGLTSEITRLVIVQTEEAPMIHLTGGTQLILPLGEDYVEPGYQVTGMHEGTLRVSVSGADVISTQPGDYLLTYTATDGTGRTVETVRTVTISETPPNESDMEIVDEIEEEIDETQWGYSLLNGLVIRQSPLTQSTSIGSLTYHEKVEVTGQQIGWYEIIWNEQIGYVYDGYFTLDKPDDLNESSEISMDEPLPPNVVVPPETPIESEMNSDVETEEEKDEELSSKVEGEPNSNDWVMLAERDEAVIEALLTQAEHLKGWYWIMGGCLFLISGIGGVAYFVWKDRKSEPTLQELDPEEQN